MPGAATKVAAAARAVVAMILRSMVLVLSGGVDRFDKDTMRRPICQAAAKDLPFRQAVLASGITPTKMRSVMRKHAALGLAVTAVLGACTTSPRADRASPDAPLQVVAAESFWGSIAAQLGGDKVAVTSIITSP